jgi:hypothetical protein
MTYNLEDKNPGDLIKSDDWNEAMKKIKGKVNKAGDAMTGPLTIDGHVGIRTTNPAAELDVNGFIIARRYFFKAQSSKTATIDKDSIVSFEDKVDPYSLFTKEQFFETRSEGFYFFSVCISFDGGTGKGNSIFLNFQKNNNSVDWVMINPSFLAKDKIALTQCHTTILDLDKGDTVNIQLTNIDSKFNLKSRNFLGFYLGKFK